MERTPGVCVNTEGCALARSGRPLLIQLECPFQCSECGNVLRPPALLDLGLFRFLPTFGVAALLLAMVVALFVSHNAQKQKIIAAAAVIRESPGAPTSKRSALGPSLPAPLAAPKRFDPGLEITALPAEKLGEVGRIADLGGSDGSTPKMTPTTGDIVRSAATGPPAAGYDRPFVPRPLRGEPSYPKSLVADGRPGRVWASCTILKDGTPRDCKVRPERGGKLFVSAVRDWLRTDAVFSPIIRKGQKVQEMHDWRVNVVESIDALRRAKLAAHQTHPLQQSQSSGEPAGSSDPDYPKEYAGTGQHGSVSVDCLIRPDGHATDCHRLQSSGGPRFVDAVLHWLAKPETHFRPAEQDGKNIASRRRLDVQFAP